MKLLLTSQPLARKLAEDYFITASAGLIKGGWFEVRNEASSQAAEILIYDQIGKDWFSDDGIAAKDFDAALKAIPAGRKINVRINSPGGNVWDGFAIFNMLKRRSADVTTINDGIAASISSLIFMAGGKRKMAKNSIFMMHEAEAPVFGNSKLHRDIADRLDKHSDIIAESYVVDGGQPKEFWRNKMSQETWMTGEEAYNFKLCDEVTNEVPLSASLNFDLSAFRRVPGAIIEQLKNSAAERGGAKNENTHMREKIIALLKLHGIAFENSATDEQLAALLDGIKPQKQEPAKPAGAPAVENKVDVTDLLKEMAGIKAQFESERKSRITNAVNKAAEEGRIPANQSEGWVKRAMADETVLTDLAALQPHLPGETPVNVELIGEDPKNIGTAILNLFGKGIHGVETAVERAKTRATIINKNLGRLIPFLNANTVNSDLKRTVILQQMIRAFAIRILPLNAFSTVFNGVRLQGTDKVAVPYFPLITTTSIDFVAGNGYITPVSTNSDAKTITVDKRKYQMLTWTSSELARQPFMDMGAAALLIGEQLGIDVVNNVLSDITIANFATLGKSSPAGSFDSDDVIDLKGSADLANWPAGGRSLLLNSTYDVNLLKDNAVKSALNFGDNAPIREGRIQRIVGFDYFPDGRIPTNSEALQGFIAYKSAELVAFSPIGPTEEVRALLTRYEVVTDPETNATFEYRLWGDPDLDTSKQIIEANYGKKPGEAAAIQRITS